jgi:hypothetical protein
LLHCAVRGSGAFVFAADDVEAGFADVVDDGAADEIAAGAIVWSAFITQFPLALQVKPKGQQDPPQVGRATLNTVVFRVLSGCAVTFCNCTSQAIALIMLQSEPLGQHKTVVFAASGMQVWPVGQQKLDGRPAREQGLKFDNGHPVSRSKRLCADRAVEEVARQTDMSTACPNPRGDLIIPPKLVKKANVPSDIAETFRVAEWC